MKNASAPATLAVAAMLLSFVHSVPAQGTAFTYQGRLNDTGQPANGIYDLQFTVYDSTNLPGNVVAGPVTNLAIAVSNGLFTVVLDFGPAVLAGPPWWLEVAARTNGSAGFTVLSPRQALTPAPYAVYANAASNLTGTLPTEQLTGTLANGQLAASSITVNAGTGLSGGGSVALGGTTTLNNAGVLSVTGNSDITASTVGGAVTLGDTATSANTAGTIVKRDAGGSFGGGSVTLNGNLNLPATSASAGIIYSGGSTLLHDYGTENFFGGPNAGNLTLSGYGNTGIGYHALLNDTSGNKNTANGAHTLEFNASGSGNVANGYGALSSNTSGSDNTANGSLALYYNTSGNGNTASGTRALLLNTSGNDNTASGALALYYNTNGSDNTATGTEALYYNTSGSDNTATGELALFSNTSGNANTASGASALAFNTNGSYNTANGVNALGNNTNGSYNTAGGAYALYYNTSGSDNTADGYEALFSNTTGKTNIALGYLAGYNVSTGSFNIHIGNVGFSNDANVIRIGSGQAQTFVAGIYGDTVSGGSPVYVNSSGQLGTGSDAGSVALLNASQTFTATNTFNGGVGINTSVLNGASFYVSGNRAGDSTTSLAWCNNTSTASNASPALRVIGLQAPDGVLSVSANVSANTANSAIAMFGNNSAFVVTITNDGTIYCKTTVNSSDRNAKENFNALDSRSVLAKLAALPVTEWNYKEDDASKRHIGPVAQDFHTAFGLNGGDDTHIATVDEAGVALAAIQGLNQKEEENRAALKGKEAEIEELKAQNLALSKRLSDLERSVAALAGRP